MFPRLITKIASAAACSVLAVAACAAVHAVAVWRHDPAHPLTDQVIAVHAFLPGDDGRTALLMATSYSPHTKLGDEARRFAARYDFTCTSPRMAGILSLDNPWLAACAAAAPYAVIATQQGDMYSLDLRDLEPQPVRLGAFCDGCPDVLECSDDGCLVFAGTTAQLWDRETGRLKWQRDDLWVRRATFLPHSHRLICGLRTGEVVEFAEATGEVELRIASHSKSIDSLAVSPCGQFVASTDCGGECVVNNLDTGETLWSAQFGCGALAAFSPDGSSVLIANPSKSWSLATANAQTRELTLHSPLFPSLISQMKSLPSGTMFLTSGQRYVKAWQPDPF